MNVPFLCNRYIQRIHTLCYIYIHRFKEGSGGLSPQEYNGCTSNIYYWEASPQTHLHDVMLSTRIGCAQKPYPTTLPPPVSNVMRDNVLWHLILRSWVWYPTWLGLPSLISAETNWFWRWWWREPFCKKIVTKNTLLKKTQAKRIYFEQKQNTN